MTPFTEPQDNPQKGGLMSLKSEGHRPICMVREERPEANLVGTSPYVIAKNPGLRAWVLERRSDGALFCLIGATTDKRQVRTWLESQVGRIFGEGTTLS